MQGRIFIVDDRMTSRIGLAASLAPAAYDVVPFESPQAAMAEARRQMPDLMLLSATLARDAAFGFARAMRALPGGTGLPMVMIGGTSDKALRLAALESGVDAMLAASPASDLLRARVRSLLRRASLERDLTRDEGEQFGFADRAAQEFARPGRITLIGPDVPTGKAWRTQLAPLLRDRIDVLDPDHALEELNGSGPPDAIVIAADVDRRGQALRLLSDLRCRSDTHRAAIVLMQRNIDNDLAVMAFDLGIDDLVEGRFDGVEMSLRLRRELARKARNDRCRTALQDGLRLAATDPLTGLFNRRYAMARLQGLLDDPDECAAGLALMVLDLDRFKRINDTLGHAAGDAVLTEVSHRMAGCLRDGDILARIGGEEFLVVLRNCDARAGARTAERLRRIVSDRPIANTGKQPVRITLSIGLVQIDARIANGTHGPAAMIDLADKALYAAKSDGRNQVSRYRAAA